MKRVWAALACCMIASVFWGESASATGDSNLIANGTLEAGENGGAPTGFTMTGAVTYGYLGNAERDISSKGCWLDASRPSGELSCQVIGLNAQQGRWLRFTFRGLPRMNFAVDNDDLYIKVAFFGKQGTVAYDAKEKKIYEQIEKARRDLSANGIHRIGGAETWRTYQLDFMLPFPQVDEVKLSVGFGHGKAGGTVASSFMVDDFSLVRIPAPPEAEHAVNQPAPIVPQGKLLPLGGRWFYAAKEGETAPPPQFDSSNAERLLYHDAVYSAPFANNTSAWLRVGNMNEDGSVVGQDRLIQNNVTITFDKDAMAIHTHSVPNHPTGRYPEQGFGNPSYIQEQEATYYIPLAPRENPTHKVTDANNANGALHMGPIGIAANGVVFFNPFDAGNKDATDLMDRCCGHPNPDNQYHYHKYPICINSPWADEGKTHSPLLGWAFDGYPVYGPYESTDVMAKDVKGEGALNGFNMHYDAQRGWHYHVTPGQFPYLIGGFWGTEDKRNQPQRNGPPGGGMMDGGMPGDGPPGMGEGDGPPPGPDGFDPGFDPMFPPPPFGG